MKKIFLSVAMLLMIGSTAFAVVDTTSTATTTTSTTPSATSTDTTTTSTTNTNATSTPAEGKKGLSERIMWNYISSIIKGLIKQSEGLKQRVISNEYINDTLESSIVKEIDADITKLNEFLTQAKSATKMSELKAIREKLQNHKKDVLQLRIRKVLAIINVTKFAQNYTKGVEDKIKALETRLGTNATQEQKDLIANAKTKIEEVKKALTDLLASINSKPLTEFNKVNINKELRTLQTKINEIKKLISQIPTQIRKEMREEKKEEKEEKKEERKEKREEKRNNKNSTTTATTTTP